MSKGIFFCRVFAVFLAIFGAKMYCLSSVLAASSKGIFYFLMEFSVYDYYFLCLSDASPLFHVVFLFDHDGEFRSAAALAYPSVA